MNINQKPLSESSKGRAAKRNAKASEHVEPPKEITPAPELTPEEKTRVEAWALREKARAKPPKFKVTQGKCLKIDPDGPPQKAAIWADAIQEATGFKSMEPGANLITQVAQAITPFFEQDSAVVQKGLNDTAAIFLEMKPEDATEALLVGQMISTNNAALDCMRRAMLKDQTAYGREFNLKFADRFMRTFTAQMEALTKYRKGGQQKVTVEHVHVYQGGQAIVGNVNQPGGGREGQRNGDATPCQQAIEAGSPGIPFRLEDGQEVWCEVQKDRTALPATRDA